MFIVEHYVHAYRYSYINITYCDLRGRIKGAAHTLYPVYLERANMANIVRTIWPYWHAGVRYLEIERFENTKPLYLSILPWRCSTLSWTAQKDF